MMTKDESFYYWTKGDKSPLNQHFLLKEFECHCTNAHCVKQRVAIELVDRLTQIRNDLQLPLKIHSGYRCAKRQEELRNQGYETAKGVSQHELGMAADVSNSSMSNLLMECNKKFQAVGAARSFIHVDLRSDRVRHWAYQKM